MERPYSRCQTAAVVEIDGRESHLHEAAHNNVFFTLSFSTKSSESGNESWHGRMLICGCIRMCELNAKVFIRNSWGPINSSSFGNCIWSSYLPGLCGGSCLMHCSGQWKHERMTMFSIWWSFAEPKVVAVHYYVSSVCKFCLYNCKLHLKFYMHPSKLGLHNISK